MAGAASFRFYLCQLNPVLGDVDGNAAKAAHAYAEAVEQGADCVLLPELFLCGYPPEDLILKPSFQKACRAAIENLAQQTVANTAMVIGTPWVEDGKLYNAVAVLHAGAVQAIRAKVDLPNYAVFDEKRLFSAGALPEPVVVKGVSLGIPVCEDVWSDRVARHLRDKGADILLVPNASPYWTGKQDERARVVAQRVRETGLPLVYLNQVGGQDDLVFDGASVALDAAGNSLLQCAAFREEKILLEWNRNAHTFKRLKGRDAVMLSADEADYSACVLGLRDYVTKNGFRSVLLGLSGGVDSALVAAMAVDALGAERVHAVMMPYHYTSQESLTDAADCAKALGIRYDILPIANGVEALQAAVESVQPLQGLALENLQSRVRGTLLMALSNNTGALVLTTGNKSEVAVGYCTLYGDMNGGFNPIKDVYKTHAYRLCHLRNRWKPCDASGPDGVVIPANILTKAPSAELRENQTDQDSLPPYDVLDAILQGLVERDDDPLALIAQGFERDAVAKVERLLNLAEYKRRQSAPGVKISRRQFGRDRRYPITNRFSTL